jgi:lysyl endopeptidase
MTIGPIRGNRIVLELLEPKNVEKQSKIALNRVDYIFDKGVFSPQTESDFGEALACHININCTQAADWQTHKKAVARVIMVLTQGTGFCSGTLVNQTSALKKPLLLTAFHCMDGYTPLYDQWKFDFEYEGTTCTNPATEPIPKSILGCQFRAGRQQTDFLLLELNPIPTNWSIFYAGWNRSATDLPTNSVFIHHPIGDIKKWSKDNNAASVFANQINWNNNVVSPANTHFLTVTDLGTFEVGSSGSSLFDQNKRIVGNLHGGNTSGNGCTVTNAYFGRFSTSWDAGTSVSTRLKEWLDPAGLLPTVLDGETPPVVTLVSVSGAVKMPAGTAVSNLKVFISDGTKTDSTLTNSAGEYQFSVEANKNYTIRPSRNVNVLNGVNGLDLVELTKHVLFVSQFTVEAKFIAGDINKNGFVTTSDIIELRKLLLGIYNNFPQNTSWRFWFDEPIPTYNADSKAISVGTTAVSNINFVGVKIGDVGLNADPSQ